MTESGGHPGDTPANLNIPAIEAAGLGRMFRQRKVLSDIALRVGRGEIFGLVGPDGAGKTTLMQVFAAILDPSEGHCRVLGFDSVREASAIARRIGYMSQGFTLYDRLSVDENLDFAARIRGVAGDIFLQRRRRLLSMAGLADIGNRRADQLSGGMRKKLALCVNLIHEPPLLLLDEPSLGVDPLSRRELWTMLRDFRSQGTTIVLTTSYMDEADLCDRLTFLDRGRILAVGAPKELQARAQGTVFELTTGDPDSAQAGLELIDQIRGVQRLPGRLRVQFGTAASAATDAHQRARVFGELRAVAPRLEDVFVLLSEPAGREAPILRLKEVKPLRSDASAIQVRGLTRRFGRFIALDNVTLDVASGEVFGFLGPNGAGKTTFIRALCGLIAPSSGEIHVAGIDVRAEPRRLRSRIGYMSQRFSLYPDLTVGENLWFFAGAYGLAGQDRRAAMNWATSMAGLQEIEDRKVSEISGAVRQRLALACSVMHRPEVLFLDEPTSGVDPGSRHRFWRLIHALATTGVTVFVTTHYLEEAAYCHRLGLMFEGRLVAAGRLDALKDGLTGEKVETAEDVFLAYMARERGRTNAKLAGASV